MWTFHTTLKNATASKHCGDIVLGGLVSDRLDALSVDHHGKSSVLIVIGCDIQLALFRCSGP